MPNRSNDIPHTGVGPVAAVLSLFTAHGDGHYGEALSQERHAVQCATLARDDGADDALVVAALLHDIGHLLSGADRSMTPTECDDHEAVGARWLAPRFGVAVARPVALHVLAKRYRCTVVPTAVDDLSPASRRSLQLQGGQLDERAVVRFAGHPGSTSALRLREWDEAAKDIALSTPALHAFVPYLRRVAERIALQPG